MLLGHAFWVTPAGIDQLSRRSYLYLRRTIGNVVRYKERIRAFCKEQKERGVQEIVLVGESDLTFILEWCAEKEGLGFRHVGSVGEFEGSEKEEPDGSLRPLEGSGKSHPDRGTGRVITDSGEAQTGDTGAGLAGSDPPARPGALLVLSEHKLETDRPNVVLLYRVALGLPAGIAASEYR